LVYRKGELSRATIDRDWPHQLALSAEYLLGKNCIIGRAVLSRPVGMPAQPQILARPKRVRRLLLLEPRRCRVCPDALWR
jgi:hypothetical protein